uniref:Uncharacterized protein n=1 Tax=Zooxanthella nutricula TaxID=1333877 RepID=A0A7S2I497_9DINO
MVPFACRTPGTRITLWPKRRLEPGRGVLRTEQRSDDAIGGKPCFGGSGLQACLSAAQAAGLQTSASPAFCVPDRESPHYFAAKHATQRAGATDTIVTRRAEA